MVTKMKVIDLRSLILIFLLACLSTACGPVVTPFPATDTPAPTATFEPTTIPATPSSPQPSKTPTPTQRVFEYETVYDENGFTVREAFLGQGAIWQWDTFQMPPSRIENTAHSLGLGREMDCDARPQADMPCMQTLQLSLSSGSVDEYTLRLDSLEGGSALLMKNGRLIWTGITNGADSFAIISSAQIGDEIAFDYSKSNWGSATAGLWKIDSILITQGKTIVLIPEAFGPYEIDGKLAYFRVKLKKETLVFDGREVSPAYDYIFNLSCCWHGPSIEIVSNGKLLDFFAQRGGAWYHVQAGRLSDIR